MASRKNAQLTDLPVHASYKIAKRLYAKARDAEGIFIPCPRWPTSPMWNCWKKKSANR
jgi:hypothetical protein